MSSLAYQCPQCHKYGRVDIRGEQILHCPNCQKEWGQIKEIEKIFKESWGCPICQCRQFYAQKDFNQVLGCAVMLVGIVLVPWTYGLSLPIFWLLDLYLHRRVEFLAVCYKCGAEFRGLKIPETFKPFMHHIGVKYDRIRIS